MENMIRKDSHGVQTPKSSSLSIHNNSHNISKPKPQIRIIHIFAPEIIKTDVANFRELVQRLTGKPGDHNINRKRPRSQETNTFTRLPNMVGGRKKEEDMLRWRHKDVNKSNNGFADFEGFISDFSGHEYPNFQLHAGLFEDTQFAN